MKILKTKLKDTFAIFKRQVIFAMNLVRFLLLGPTKMRCATAGWFSIMHFNSTNDQAADEYLTVAQMSQRYPAFSEGSIRWLIFNSKNNNFGKVVRKIGRKVILNLREFRIFLEEQSSK